MGNNQDMSSSLIPELSFRQTKTETIIMLRHDLPMHFSDLVLNSAILGLIKSHPLLLLMSALQRNYWTRQAIRFWAASQNTTCDGSG
jgi:uncharacterized membrane protein YwaF